MAFTSMIKKENFRIHLLHNVLHWSQLYVTCRPSLLLLSQALKIRCWRFKNDCHYAHVWVGLFQELIGVLHLSSGSCNFRYDSYMGALHAQLKEQLACQESKSLTVVFQAASFNPESAKKFEVCWFSRLLHYSKCFKVANSWWKFCLGVKQLGSGWDDKLLCVSSGFTLLYITL